MSRKKESGVVHDWTRYADYLALFVIRVQELKERRYYKFLESCKIESHQDDDKIPLIDEEILISFLAVLRQFSLTKSCVKLEFVRSVCRKVAAKHLPNDWATQLESIERHYKKRNRKQFMIRGLTEDELLLKDEELLDVFLNAKYFHADERGYKIMYGLEERMVGALRREIQYYLHGFAGYVIAHQPLVYQIWSSGVLPSGQIVLDESRPCGD